MSQILGSCAISCTGKILKTKSWSDGLEMRFGFVFKVAQRVKVSLWCFWRDMFYLSFITGLEFAGV
jgi:hypothetical protein